ncbi:MAG: hypothetical protein JWM02_1026 [Frankiales bacterium]|nr:hypothetical protein [Frankiales bacterium]
MHQATGVLRPRTWLSRCPREIVVAAGLLLTFGLLTLGAIHQGGGLVALDLWVHRSAPHGLEVVRRSAVSLVVDLGLRGAISGVALAYAAWLSWRARSWRPLLIMITALLALNLVVGSLKLLLGRLSPNQGAPTMFAGGTEFPSGHASNSLVTWGTVLWLQQRYDPRRLSAAVGRVVLLTIAGCVGIGTLFLDTHWLSDVLAGWAIGALLLLALPLTDRVRMSSPWRRGTVTVRPISDLLPRTSFDRGRSAPLHGSKPEHRSG